MGDSILNSLGVSMHVLYVQMALDECEGHARPIAHQWLAHHMIDTR